MVYLWIRLLYLTNLLLFMEFFGISQIWTTSDSNNRIKWVEKWYSCYWVRCEALPRKWKEFRTSCSENTTKNVWPNGFKILKKENEVWKSWDLFRSHDIICGGYGKNLRKFHTIHHVWCLQTEVSQKKNYSVEKD